jgi:hypothetical protein
MDRIEIDVITGVRQIVQLTAEEITQTQVKEQAWLAEKAAEPTKEEQIARLQAQIDALKA